MNKTKYKVLLIEDDESLLNTTKDFLEEEGFETLCATDGLEGIQQAINNQPDIILADISMPKLDGYQVYKTLQENSDTSFIPFIFISAKTSKEDMRAGMQLGADDYITKPFDYEELLTTINTRIAKRDKLIGSLDKRFEALLDNTLTGIYIIDEKMKFIHFNTKIAKIFGYDQDEMNKLTFLELISPADKEEVEEKLRKVFRKVQSHFSLKCMGIDRKQKSFPISLYAGNTNIMGKPGIIGNVIDAPTGSVGNNAQELFLSKYGHDELAKAVDYVIQNKAHISSDQNQKIKSVLDESVKPLNLDINITEREQEVLQLICEGYTNQEIANKLFISQRTVDGHRSNLMDKSHTRNTAELVMYAVKNKLVEV